MKPHLCDSAQKEFLPTEQREMPSRQVYTPTRWLGQGII